jgi:transcriptional regulator with XRE-family HTH domain
MTDSMETFPEILRRLMEARGLSQYALAKAVGVSQSYVAQMARGAGPFAEGRIEAWADALGVTGAERARFRLLALLTRCPEEVRAHVARLEGRRPPTTP